VGEWNCQYSSSLFIWPEVGVEEQRIAALCGSSLFMAGLEASLKAIDGFAVVRIDTTLPNAVDHLAVLCPDVVIFDLDAPQAQFVVSFLSEHPGLPLVGLGLTSDRVVVLSSQQYTAQTMRDLARVIQIIQPGAAEQAPDGILGS
jgi:DNA-binding NarL/FixJ family response regulator